MMPKIFPVPTAEFCADTLKTQSFDFLLMIARLPRFGSETIRLNNRPSAGYFRYFELLSANQRRFGDSVRPARYRLLPLNDDRHIIDRNRRRRLCDDEPG